MPDMIEARTPYMPGAAAPVLPPAREVRVRPARRIDLIACLADGFDLAEQEAPGHAARVASLARDIAARLGLKAEVQRSALEAGLLHDAGVSVPIAGDRAAGGAWVAQRFGLNVAVQDAVRASRERWDGGGPLALAGAGIPRASLCVRAAHWVCETAEHAGNPLRARAEIARTPVEALIPALGPEVAAAARDVVRVKQVYRFAVYQQVVREEKHPNHQYRSLHRLLQLVLRVRVVSQSHFARQHQVHDTCHVREQSQHGQKHKLQKYFQLLLQVLSLLLLLQVRAVHERRAARPATPRRRLPQG